MPPRAPLGQQSQQPAPLTPFTCHLRNPKKPSGSFRAQSNRDGRVLGSTPLGCPSSVHAVAAARFFVPPIFNFKAEVEVSRRGTFLPGPRVIRASADSVPSVLQPLWHRLRARRPAPRFSFSYSQVHGEADYAHRGPGPVTGTTVATTGDATERLAATLACAARRPWRREACKSRIVASCSASNARNSSTSP